MLRQLIPWTLLGLLLAFVSLVLIAPFTPSGDVLLKYALQHNLKKTKDYSFRVEKFSLTPSRVDIAIHQDDNVFIKTKGDFSLPSQSLNLTIQVDIKDTTPFSSMMKAPISGPFKMLTTIRGPLHNPSIKTTTTDPNALLNKFRRHILSDPLYAGFIDKRNLDRDIEGMIAICWVVSILENDMDYCSGGHSFFSIMLPVQHFIINPLLEQ